MASSRPLIIAHRGLAERGARNTLIAFERAIQAGADMVECDVRQAQDGFVVFHNARIRGRRIAGMTKAEISRRAGVNVPWLTDVLKLAQRGMGLNVELKEAGDVAEIIGLVRQYCDPRRTIISSFLDSVVVQSKRVAPEFRTSLMLGNPNPLTSLSGRWSELYPGRRLERIKCDLSSPFQGYAQLGAVARADGAGRQSIVWTVNSRRGLKRWLKDPRVFGVTTDRTDLAIEIAKTL